MKALLEQNREKKRGVLLERERMKIVGDSFRAAGETNFDVSKKLDISKAFVVPDAVPDAPDLSAYEDLENEIKNIQSAFEKYRERIDGAKQLLDAGKISKEQFNKFSGKELANFKKNDPTIQARNSLRKELMTPMELFRESIQQAAKLFSNEPVMFERARAAAEAQFKANDKATQLARQLETPLESFNRATEEAHKVFANDPKNLQRALTVAADQFRAIDPVSQLRQSLLTPLEVYRTRMDEVSKVLAGVAPALRGELFQRAKKQATEQFNQNDPDRVAAKGIRESLKSEGQLIAEKISQASDLVKNGLLNKSELGELRKKLFDDALGKKPKQESFAESLQVRSSALASQIGNFAPVLNSDDQKTLEYQKEQRDLQRETNEHLKKIAKRRDAKWRR